MSELVVLFVNGRVQNRFRDLSRAIEEFFAINQPIIESVYLAIKIFEKKTIASLGSDEVQSTLRKDLEGATKSLGSYNRIFGRVDTSLALMSSNFNLPRFLAENEIQDANQFQKELNKYWEMTYGDMIRNWGAIRDKLSVLRDILEKEVRMLEQMPNVTFFEGFKESAELRALFKQEKDIFHQVMQIYEASNNLVLKKTAAMLEVQISKTKAELKILLRFLRNNYTSDLSNATNMTQKSIISLLYLLGAYNVVREAKTTLAKKGISKVLNFALHRNYSGLKKKSDHLMAVRGHADAFLTSQMTKPEELIAHVTAIYDAVA